MSAPGAPACGLAAQPSPALEGCALERVHFQPSISMGLICFNIQTGGFKNKKKNKRCPFIFPSQLCLQHGWGMNGRIPLTHGLSPQSNLRSPTRFGFKAFHSPGSGLKSDSVSTDLAWSSSYLRAESLLLILLPTPSSSCLRLPPSWEAPSSQQIPPHPAAHACSKLELPAPACRSTRCCLGKNLIYSIEASLLI